MTTPPSEFASRAGAKLAHALDTFGVDPTGLVCADLGCSTGGFTDCLLQRGAARVYAVDTGYGVLDWKLRNDPRVVTLERTNALHVTLPEPVDLVTVDTSWTPQRLILPQAQTLLKPGGRLITLIKPHYEAAPAERRGGVVQPDVLAAVLERVTRELAGLGITLERIVESPIVGSKGGNREYLALVTMQ